MTEVNNFSKKHIELLGIPLDWNSSFLKGAADAPDRIRTSFFCSSSNMWTENGIDLDQAGLKGPSSTWTYMISDDQFKEDLTKKILGQMVGGAAAAFTLGPVIFIWGLFQRFKMKRKRELL